MKSSLSVLRFREVEKGSFSNYFPLLPANKRNDILRLAKKLRGKRIIHLNAAPKGGGVAEILKSLIPLERDLGLTSEWYTIRAPRAFFVITKKIHNALQSAPLRITAEEKRLYLKINKNIAYDLKKIKKADIYVIHDPQPLALIAYFHEGSMISRIHIDLSDPDPDVLSFLKPYLRKYNCLIFSMKEFAVPGVRTKKSYILPAIDPFAIKNISLREDARQKILEDAGINPTKPLISQISRFDPWKDPLGVIQAYYHAKNEIPDLQLALVGFAEAQDDPEAQEIFEQVQKHAKGDPDIHIFFDPKTLGAFTNEMLVNAVQSGSDVVLQKSLKEGFGLTVTEAMWKGKAVVAGNVGGIRKQIRSGKDGFLVNTPMEAADRIVELIRDKKLNARLGASAHMRSKNNFLMSRHLHEHLKLYQKMLN
ncbi:MAG: glycosyltransferase [bacterium]|nr:glycosyltransferase [bacterium]